MNSYQEQQRKSLRAGNIVISVRNKRRLPDPDLPEHQDVTALLMGDPIPGRSALDRKNEAQQR